MTHDEIMRGIDSLRSSTDFSFVFGTRKDGWVVYVINFHDARNDDGASFVLSSHMQTFYANTFDAAAILSIEYVKRQS